MTQLSDLFVKSYFLPYTNYVCASLRPSPGPPGTVVPEAGRLPPRAYTNTIHCCFHIFELRVVSRHLIRSLYVDLLEYSWQLLVAL